VLSKTTLGGVYLIFKIFGIEKGSRKNNAKFEGLIFYKRLKEIYETWGELRGFTPEIERILQEYPT
jgi:hypothetical protein